MSGEDVRPFLPPPGDRLSLPADESDPLHQKTGMCLSIRQPWAWCIVNGYKPVENRLWSTSLRGWFGIHASGTFEDDALEWIREAFPDLDIPTHKDDFLRGGIVGRARLVGVVQDGDEHPAAISPWFFGPYGFVLADAEPLPFQKCRGQLRFFRPKLQQESP